VPRELRDWSERGSENLEGTLDWAGTDKSDGRAQRRTFVWKRALANLKLTGGSVNGDGTPKGGGTPGNRVWMGIAETGTEVQKCSPSDQGPRQICLEQSGRQGEEALARWPQS